MTPAFGRAAAPLLTLLIGATAAGLAWLHAGAGIMALMAGSSNDDIAQMVLVYSTLPRMATALLCGAGLALSGTLFQQVLRNPLASPTTLGISAGANLALVIVSLLMPGLLGFGRDLTALTGSGVAGLLIFALGARRGFSPFSLVLSGMVISLWCGALAAILVLMNDRYLVSLFIWGSGSLSQQSWAIPLALLPKLGVLALLAGLLMRPLALLDLGEESAVSLGLKMAYLRFAAIAVAVALAAFITSAVGVIGFIGLVAPTIARLTGARKLSSQLIWSTLIGAALLWLTDETVQKLAGLTSDFLPTGAVTAIFGSPLLLILLPRLKAITRGLPQARQSLRMPLVRPSQRNLVLLCAGSVVLLAVALMLGREPDGRWSWLSADDFAMILPLRAPHVLAALAAGAMLAVAGSMLQRLTGNEMASPEVLGISAGATIGITLSLFLLTAPGLGVQIGFAALGAFVVLIAIIAFGYRSGFAPERVLLTGIALGALIDAVVGILAASGDPRALMLMRWMSGSTYSVDATRAVVICILAIVLIAASLTARRWLALLPLGPVAALELGIPVSRARFVLFGLAAALSAGATLIVGPLSFVGLMGPHLAREAGLTRATPQLLGAAFAGGALMVLADWAGRMLAFPYQMPAGLVSALAGAPFLMLLLRRRG